MTMAVNEAVENAIEHAHRLSAEPFEVELARAGGEITVIVRDRGRWGENGTSHADRGRGLELMRALMDEVTIEPSPRGSTVLMRRRLGQPAPSP